MDKHVKYLIIGAGITGISLAEKLKKDYLIIEKEEEIGGYCKTFKNNGFIWDFAGHFFHFNNTDMKKKFIEYIGERNIIKKNKNTKIYYREKLINYPFQKHIHELEKDEFIDCLWDLYNKEEKDVYDNFLDMLYGKFGKSIVEKFLKPYNEKLYACNLKDLDQDAMGRFFPYANIKEIIDSMKNDVDSSYNSNFLYPKDGAQSFINAIGNRLNKNNIVLSTEIKTIDKMAKCVITSNGDRIKFDYLINTIPFNIFLKLFNDKNYASLVEKLSYNKVLVFNLGFKNKSKFKEHWIYVPDKNINFYRVGFYDNILDHERLSLYIEIGFDKNSIINVEKELELTLDGLKKMGITENNILLNYNYVIMDPAYVHINSKNIESVNNLKKELSEMGIYSIGRYGAWTYCSMEDCMLEATSLANYLEERESKNER